MYTTGDWIVRESTPNFEKLEATRNHSIQVGWIRNRVETPTHHRHFTPDFKVQLMLEHVVEGGGTIYYSDGSSLEVPPNCIHLSNPYKQIVEQFTPAGQHESYHIIIPPLFYDTLLSFGLAKPGVFILPVPKDFDWKPRLYLLVDELMACKTQHIPAFVGRLYGEICEVLTLSLESTARGRTEVLQQIAAILSQTQEIRLPLPEIAAQFGLSLRTMERQFTDFYGVSPKQFRIARRMEIATRILDNSPHLSVVQIAKTLGYPSPFAFSRQFKEYCGLSPTEYQHQVLTDAPPVAKALLR